VSIACGLALITAACAPPAASIAAGAEPYLTPLDQLLPAALAPAEKLRVVATTSILADVVGRVGGDHIELVSLIPIGVDPHAFEPTPRDAQALAAADAVFINGFGLEAFLEDLIRQAGGSAPVVSASLGIAPLPFEGDEHDDGGEDEDHGADPHTWLDPNNVMHWTQNIEAALSALDPSRAEAYVANGEAYRSQLAALDDQIREAVSRIPQENRRLVTDHDELGYFADEYGFTIVGTVIPGASSLADPSAAQLAHLLDQVRAQAAPAVFVSSVVNPALVEAFAADAGMHVAMLYAHSLTADDGPAPSYLELMRYNAETIAAALTP
jgi:ABC-type Zn uptake system ZnuABC Zn-binding protein ZnuA